MMGNKLSRALDNPDWARYALHPLLPGAAQAVAEVRVTQIFESAELKTC